MKILTLSTTLMMMMMATMVQQTTTNRLNRDEVSAADRIRRPSRSLTAETVNSTTIILKGLPQNNGDSDTCPITQYLIRLKQQGANRMRTITVDGVRQSVSLHGLAADTIYNVRLVTVSCEGRSKPSRWVTVRTTDQATALGVGHSGNAMHETTAPGEPKNVVTQAFSDSVLVSWKAPEDSAVVRGYVVGYGEGVPDVNWQYIEGHRRNVTVRNLKKGTQYVISVRAFNNVGKGPVVYELVYTNENPGPSGGSLLAPVQIKTKVLSPTTVWVEWTDPNLPSSGSRQAVNDNRYYSIHYQASTRSNSAERSEQSRKNQIVLNGLVPATRYEFKVRLVKDGQTSPFSITVANRTFETVPGSPPRSVTVTSSGDDPEHSTLTAFVQWRPPRLNNGNITDYMIQYTDNVELPSERWQSLMVRLKTEGTVDGLQKGKNYFFRVQARNSFGYGPKSDIVKMMPANKNTAIDNIKSGTSSSPSGEEKTDQATNQGEGQESIIIALNGTDEEEYDYPENDKKEIETASLLQDATHTDANKKKREPILTSSDPDVIVPDVVSDTTRLPSDVAFKVLLSYKISAFITWPEYSEESCGKGERVLGYRLRYRRAGETGESSWVSKNLSENVAMIDSLDPNSKYKYQVKYIIDSETKWSSEQEFDTNPSKMPRP